MTIERSDVDALRERHKQQDERSNRLTWFDRIFTETRPYEQLVNDPAWNIYANDLSGWLKASQDQANVLAAQLTDATQLLTSDQVTALRIRVANLRGEVAAWMKAFAWVEHMVKEKNKLEDDLRQEAISQHA